VTLLARGTAVPELRRNGTKVRAVRGDHRIERQQLKVPDVEHANREGIASDILVVATRCIRSATR
jgi:hypothetical protein